MNASNTVAAGTYVSCALDRCPDDATAIKFCDGSIDYGSLADATHYLADRLQCSGVGADSRVGLFLGGGIEWIFALCALERLNATVVMLDVAELPSTTAHRVESAGVDLLVGHASVDDLLDDVMDEIGFGDLPAAVAEEYSLMRVAPVVRGGRAEVICLDDLSTTVSRCWADVVDAAARVAATLRLRPGSMVSITGSLLSDRSVVGLVAAFAAGASVSIGRPLDEFAAPHSTAVQVYEDEVTDLIGGSSHIEMLVRSGVVGVLPRNATHCFVRVPPMTEIARIG